YALRPPLHSFPTRRSSDLALARPPPARRLLVKLFGLVEELVALAEQPVDHRERRGDLPREVGFLFLGELFLVDVNDFLDRDVTRSEEHTSELQSRFDLVCR